MTSIRFFTDEDVYGAVAVQLRAAGFDAVSTSDMNRLDELDEPHVEWAAQEHRVLVTFNVGHFAQLHYQWMASSRQRSIGEVMRRLLHLARTLAADDMLDRLEYLSNW